MGFQISRKFVSSLFAWFFFILSYVINVKLYYLYFIQSISFKINKIVPIIARECKPAERRQQSNNIHQKRCNVLNTNEGE